MVALASTLNTERYPYGDVRSLHRLPRYVRPKSLQLPAVEAALELLARPRRAAIIHVHHGYALDRVLRPARRQRLPVVLSLHGHDVTEYLEKRPDAYRQCHDVVSAVVVPSTFLVDYAERAGFDREIIRVQPSGVDLSSFSPSPIPTGLPTALFVGRFVPKKGVDVLAQAWPAVQARIPEARLVLCGFGQQEELARSIPGNVTVLISPDRTVVRSQMRDCRVVVSPSHAAPDDAIESLLVVNVEAQASGRPVVTTCHGAIPEFVAEGRSALLVDEHDAYVRPRRWCLCSRTTCWRYAWVPTALKWSPSSTCGPRPPGWTRSTTRSWRIDHQRGGHPRPARPCRSRDPAFGSGVGRWLARERPSQVRKAQAVPRAKAERSGVQGQKSCAKRCVKGRPTIAETNRATEMTTVPAHPSAGAELVPDTTR